MEYLVQFQNKTHFSQCSMATSNHSFFHGFLQLEGIFEKSWSGVKIRVTENCFCPFSTVNPWKKDLIPTPLCSSLPDWINFMDWISHEVKMTFFGFFFHFLPPAFGDLQPHTQHPLLRKFWTQGPILLWISPLNWDVLYYLPLNKTT